MKSSRTWLILAVLAIAGITTSFLLSNKQQSDNLKSIRNNWSSYVFRQEIKYKAAVIGGINAFDVPIENNSDYLIDKVIVEVKYIKASGGTYKTENVTINNIPPRSIKTSRAPRSPRGTSIDANIIEVISRGLQLCYPNGMGFGSDPYMCR